MGTGTEVQDTVLASSSIKKGYKLGHDFKTQLEPKIMLLPSIHLIFIFSFIPLFGLIMAFKKFSHCDIDKHNCCL